MKADAVWAFLIAIVCMLIYIWIRFKDVRFATSAVAALLHDVLVVLAFYAALKWSVVSTFIACILTIVGYSINATIVVFDRIRENSKSMKRGEQLEDMINKSVSQTLSRSINTSVTTGIMVLVLLIFGVSSIREFAMPLMVGICCGCFSSVCLAGSLWHTMKSLKKKED